MVDTVTPNLGLVKPEVAGSKDTWGTKLNVNFDVLDNLLPASYYNAADILSKLTTVDGEGSGLDADTLDGHDSSHFAVASDVSSANATQDAAIAARVLKAGDTMTGNLTVATATGTGSILVAPVSGSVTVAVRKSASGLVNQIVASTGTFIRWVIQLGDATAESGGDTGSSFGLFYYDDTGTFKGTALTVGRVGGVVNMPMGATTLTQPAGDNDTSVATTAFVTAAIVARPAVATISDTMPSTPIVGQLHWNSADGNLYIWYNDGDSSQWVQVNGTGT